MDFIQTRLLQREKEHFISIDRWKAWDPPEKTGELPSPVPLKGSQTLEEKSGHREKRIWCPPEILPKRLPLWLFKCTIIHICQWTGQSQRSKVTFLKQMIH